MQMSIRTYSDLIALRTFEERFRYLQLNGRVGQDTFGFDRYLNQVFYRSFRWKEVRNQIIIRDNGCDLGIPGREIYDKIIIHHMNPLLLSDIENEDTMNEKKNSPVQKRCVVKPAKLNIRKRPYDDAVIVAVVVKDTVLTYEDTASPGWHKVRTNDGVDGYCKSEFVEDKEWKAS